MIPVVLQKSVNPAKKYMVLVDGKTVHFGASGMSDYTINRDPIRKSSYLRRHKTRENWTKKGLKTAGFWSRWLLWNKTTLKSSIKDIRQRFGIRVRYYP